MSRLVILLDCMYQLSLQTTENNKFTPIANEGEGKMKTYPENLTLDPLDWNLCSISCKKHKKSKLETPNIKLKSRVLQF